MFDKVVFSLDSGPSNLTDFRRIELFPLLLVEFEEKRNDRTHRDEINESVTDITLVLRKVRKRGRSLFDLP